MTDHDRVSANPNGKSVQLYFKKAFAQDTAFPLEAGDDCVAWVVDGKLVIAPLDAIDDMEFPATVDPPPDGALPPECRPRRDDRDAEPPESTPSTRP